MKKEKTPMKSVRHKFLNNETYLPITMQQFTDLAMEFLPPLNKIAGLVEPNVFNADYVAQMVEGAIHALDHKHGVIRKNELFESVVNRISCHVTYHGGEVIRKRLNPNKTEPGEGAKLVDEPSDNVVPIEAATENNKETASTQH